MRIDVKLLHPELRVILYKFLKECEENNLKVLITEGFRTKKRQNDLYAQGRTKPGNIVTNAKYPLSGHCWGVAFDFARNDGNGLYNDSDNFFYKVGQIGKKCGLFWGGDFVGFTDKPHFEMKKFMPNASVSMLLKKYKTPKNFMKTWEDIEVANKECNVRQLGFKYEDRRKVLDVINKDNFNYVKIRELSELLNLTVHWDSNKKETIFSDKFIDTKYKYEEKEEEFAVLNKQGENYIKVRDILGFLGFNVDYEPIEKKTIIYKEGTENEVEPTKEQE